MPERNPSALSPSVFAFPRAVGTTVYMYKGTNGRTFALGCGKARSSGESEAREEVFWKLFDALDRVAAEDFVRQGWKALGMENRQPHITRRVCPKTFKRFIQLP